MVLASEWLSILSLGLCHNYAIITSFLSTIYSNYVLISILRNKEINEVSEDSNAKAGLSEDWAPFRRGFHLVFMPSYIGSSWQNYNYLVLFEWYVISWYTGYTNLMLIFGF